MKIQDCELLPPKTVEKIQDKLSEIMRIAEAQQKKDVDGACAIWNAAYEISWLVSPKQ